MSNKKLEANAKFKVVVNSKTHILGGQALNGCLQLAKRKNHNTDYSIYCLQKGDVYHICNYLYPSLAALKIAEDAYRRIGIIVYSTVKKKKK